MALTRRPKMLQYSIQKLKYSQRFEIENKLVYIPANCKVNLPNNRPELGDS